MRAAVCYEFGQPLVVEEVHLEAPADDEARVRLSASAICHTDLHLIRGEWGGEPPLIAGHEAAGIVTEVGAGVGGVALGDRVVVCLIRFCGSCQHCLSGLVYLCDHAFGRDRESGIHNTTGRMLARGVRSAAFADEVVVHQSQLIPVPEEVPLEAAALLGCGAITGLGAVLNTAGVEAGASVAVLGAGGVGLNSIQAAAMSGAGPIVAVDVSQGKLASARLFGATDGIDASVEDVKTRVMEITQDRGVDYVFVTVGTTAAVEEGFGLLARTGTEVLVGIPDMQATAALPIIGLVSERRVIGSHNGSTLPGLHIPRYFDMYRRGRLQLDELISGRYRLEEINRAIDELAGDAARRHVIVFD